MGQPAVPPRIDAGKLEQALAEGLQSIAGRDGVETVADAQELLIDEALRSGAPVPTQPDGLSLSLSELEAAPLTAVLLPHLVEYLQLPHSEALLLLGDVFDSYAKPKIAVEEPIDSAVGG